MGTSSDAIIKAAAAAEANFAATKTALAGIQTGVTALDAKIKDLAAKLGGGALTPAQQAALDALVNDSAALTAQAGAIDTTIPAGT